MKKTVLEPVFKNKESIWKNRVLGFEKVGSDENWVRQKLPEAMPIPAFVNGSDPRDSISEVGQTARGKCFLKLSDLSFHSVQFALKESAYRVCRDLAQTKKRPLICSLEIKTGGGKFWAYQLSSNLNTLIGSRGSGKSLMIEVLRWGLGLDAGEGDSRYKRDMLDYWLKRGGEVTINGINEHGDTARITRAYTEKTNPAPPQVWVNDQESKIAIGSIFPGLLYFGQKDLGERQETFNETFFAQLLGVFPENLGVKEDRAATAFKKTIDSFLTASKAKSQDDELKYEQESLRKKLEVFKQHGVEPRLKEITDFDQDVRRFRSFKKHYEESFAELDAEITSWVSGFAGIEIFKAAVTESFRNQFDVIVGTFSEAKAQLEQGRQSASAIAMLLNELNKALESKRQELQAQFAGILREVEAPDLNIDAYRTMVSRYEQIVEIRRLSEEQGGRTSRFEKEMLAAGQAWHQAKLEITAFYQAKIQDINQNLPASLRLSIDPQADRDDFRSFLESIFRGARFNETSYESILDCCQNGLEIYKRRKQIAETELTPGMAEIFNQKLDEKFKDILTFLPKDRRAIRYDEAYISELSLGKRAMALLLLLLSLDKHAIILLDQPEDDLDNETIHRMVVQPLLKKKESIQFIIATHNPNIPVLGDAEQVIACEEASRGELKHDITGSLDKNSVKDAIVKIMEGGQEAFDKRHDIYTLWKNSN
jgi:predicted ATPase